MSLRKLALKKIVNSIVSSPETIQDEIIGTTKSYIEEKITENIMSEIISLLPELVVEMVEKLKSGVLSSNITDDPSYTTVDCYLLEMAKTIAIEINTSIEDYNSSHEWAYMMNGVENY